MSQRAIQVDTERLGALASSVALAHSTLAASPRYAHLEAGDVRRRLPDAVSDFITMNEGPREELRASLECAANTLDAAWRGFSETESCLVRALTGEES